MELLETGNFYYFLQTKTEPANGRLFAENGTGERPFVCCKRKLKTEICFS
jgi:hypothetical protein